MKLSTINLAITIVFCFIAGGISALVTVPIAETSSLAVRLSYIAEIGTSLAILGATVSIYAKKYWKKHYPEKLD